MNSKYKTLPKEKRKKILLMSDDLRGFSGVGVVSKAIVLGTIHRFDWVEIGALLNHPDKGKLIDMSDFVQKETGIQDASLKIYPYDSYGNQTLVRQIIEMEKPDAILPYTDPRS